MVDIPSQKPKGRSKAKESPSGAVELLVFDILNSVVAA
jgi:hypothetical protein